MRQYVFTLPTFLTLFIPLGWSSFPSEGLSSTYLVVQICWCQILLCNVCMKMLFYLWRKFLLRLKFWMIVFSILKIVFPLSTDLVFFFSFLMKSQRYFLSLFSSMYPLFFLWQLWHFLCTVSLCSAHSLVWFSLFILLQVHQASWIFIKLKII